MSGKVKLPPYIVVQKWNEEKVIKWLRKVNLEDCIPAFQTRNIDGKKLLELTEPVLFCCQDMKIKHRRQIARCVDECKSQASNAKRIVGTIRKRRARKKTSEGTQENGDYESDDDFDYWDSDFDDFDDDDEPNDEARDAESGLGEKDKEPLESNNNNKLEELPWSNNEHVLPLTDDIQNNVNQNGTHDINQNSTHLEPVKVEPVVSVSSKSKSMHASPQHRNTIPRLPIKRPLIQPPPPPITQTPSQEEQLQEYEVPISHQPDTHVPPLPSTKPPRCQIVQQVTDHSTALSNGSLPTETYEVVQPVEETYEIVQSPPIPVNPPDKPKLPPRIAASGVVSLPPPLPVKPKNLQEAVTGLQFLDNFRSLDRPKLPVKQEEESVHESGIFSPASGLGSTILNSFLGRRNSANSLPRQHYHSKERINTDSVFSVSSRSSLGDSHSSRSSSPEKENFFTVGSSTFIASTAAISSIETTKPVQNSVLKQDEIGQTMATRPLPPVPQATTNVLSNKQGNVTDFSWFHEVEREDAEHQIKNLGISGAFLVRPSKRAGKENPYTLTIFHNSKVFHLNIRQRQDDTFALGKEKKKEKTFATVADLISYHQKEPILLTSRGESAGQTILGIFPEK